jgi:hypothetical protein
MGRVQAMMNNSGMKGKIREGSWAEIGNTATLIDNGLTTEGDQHSNYKRFFGTEPPYMQELRTVGEVCVARNHRDSKIRSKLVNRGMVCIFVGYTTNHVPKVYRLLKMSTNKLILSRDIIWRNCLYGDWQKLNEGKHDAILQDGLLLSNEDNNDDFNMINQLDDDDDTLNFPMNGNVVSDGESENGQPEPTMSTIYIPEHENLNMEPAETEEDEVTQDPNMNSSQKIKGSRAMRRLEGFFNPEATDIGKRSTRQQDPGGRRATNASTIESNLVLENTATEEGDANQGAGDTVLEM